MDRLKFRAWEPESKGMVYFDNEKAANDPYIGQALLLLMAGKHPSGETAEQCTGLKDANGVLIYEGDILRCKDPEDNSTFTVIWQDGHWCQKFVDWDTDYQYPKMIKDYVDRWFTVIGNIHENPELMENTDEL